MREPEEILAEKRSFSLIGTWLALLHHDDATSLLLQKDVTLLPLEPRMQGNHMGERAHFKMYLRSYASRATASAPIDRSPEFPLL